MNARPGHEGIRACLPQVLELGEQVRDAIAVVVGRRGQRRVIDLAGLSIVDPPALESRLNQIVGVVTNGLFACRGADVCLLATADGVLTLTAG